MLMSASIGDAIKPAKRSIFNKPAWAKTSAPVQSGDLFSRSNQTYLAIAAEEEARLKRRAAKKEVASSKLPSPRKQREPASKRRKTEAVSDSEEDRDSDDGLDSETETPATSFAQMPVLQCGMQNEEATGPIFESPSAEIGPPPSEPPQCRLIRSRERSDDQAAEASNVINLDSSEDEHGTEGQDAATTTGPHEEDNGPGNTFGDSQRPADLPTSHSAEEDEVLALKGAPLDTPDPMAAHPVSSPGRASSIAAPVPTPEPTIQLMITSDIPNTTALIAKRRLDQRFKDVRVFWCKRQEFTPEMEASVLLTWRGQKLFNSQTCKGLGISVDAEGQIMVNGKHNPLSSEQKRVQLTAMTDEMYEASKRVGVNQGQPAAEDDDELVANNEPRKPVEVQIRIILRSKVLEEFKLIVKPVRQVCFHKVWLQSLILLVHRNLPHHTCF